MEDFYAAQINKTITDMIEDHILVCDMEGRILFSNRAIQSYLGYTALELNERHFLSIISELHANKAEAFFKGAKEEHSNRAEFLFAGKQDILKLHLKIFKKGQLIYIYGNEKYVEYERIKKKLEVEISNAVKIHRRFLPGALPDTENIAFASLYIPAEELGGDLYDVFKVDNGLLNDYFEQYVCFIADVSGHGLDSAMLAIFIKDTIKSYFRLKHVPGQLLSPKEIMHFFIEQYIKEGYPEEYLVCLYIAVFDLRTKELTYCNAGIHTCPFLIRDGAGIMELDSAGLPISSAIDTELLKYEDATLPLSASATMFIMSDGLPEQRSKSKFYDNRLKKLAAEIYSLRPCQIVKRIHEDFTDFLNYEKIKDDITLVVVKLSFN